MGFFKKELIWSADCFHCRLCEECNSPKMGATGDGLLNVLIVAEAPGREEDRTGVQLVGAAGKLLREILRKHDLDLDVHFKKINSVNCRPPRNRKPTRQEIEYCRPNIQKLIKEYKPKHIWLFGSTAIESFYAGSFSDLSITRWRGLCLPDKDSNAWIWPMYHPAYILRKSKDRNLRAIFEIDLKRAIKKIKKDRPKFVDYTSKISCLYDLKEVENALRYFSVESPLTAFDYETSGLQPFQQGSLVWSASVSDGKYSASFPIDYPHWSSDEKKKVIGSWKAYLRSKSKKVAHNMQFENKWSIVKFNVPKVRNFLACTQTDAHIIDERFKYSGLKFQAYLHFGDRDYETEEIERHKKTNKKLGRNTLDRVPLPKLLMYGGLDSLYCFKLRRIQERIFKRDPDLKAMSDLFNDGCRELSEAQIIGIALDEIYYVEETQSLKDKIDNLTDKIYRSKEARLFKDRTGRKLRIKNKDFSADDLRVLFFDIMKVKAKKKTSKGFKSVDKEVLHEIGSPLAKRILRRRKLNKIKDTYLSGFIDACYEGRIHPNWNLSIPRSGRSSSSDPNFQNIPVRDEEAKAYTRKGVKPSPGNRLAFFDYGGHEVRIIACYSKAKALIDFIVTGGDMHREEASYIFLLPEKEVPKKVRFYAKNQFVFPEFYGSYYVNCAANLWETCIDLKLNNGITVREHLREEGIRNEADFEYHIKGVEKRFWETFPEVKEWQERLIREYRKKGYVSSFFGFRRRGYLSNNAIINTAVQGTAFHCLLWSFNKVSKYSRRHWDHSFLVGQIHDEIVADIHPKEKDEVVSVVVDFMENKIREEHDWLVVPLEAEIEMTKKDQAWFYKEKYNG